MGNSSKLSIWFAGIISAAFLFFLVPQVEAVFVPQIDLPIICSFSGPENSPDLLRLTDFLVTGPSSLKVGDSITVSFKLQNYGQYDLNLGQKGIFVAARNPDNSDVSFGFTRQNTTFKLEETISVSATKVLDKAGTWKVWPSYHLSLATGEKFGPDEWHVCTIQVSPTIKDSDQDGIPDDQDNCPSKYNPQQEDIDGDGIGDVCDTCDDRDFDHDGIKNCLDKCPDKPETYNQYQDDDGCPDTLPITTQPDLFIDRIICDTQNNRIGYVVKNGGNQTAPSGHKTVLILNGQVADEDLVNVSLEPGYTHQGYFSNYQLTESVVMSICADHDNVVSESNEDNNCKRSECVVRREETQPPTPSLPDLVVDPYNPFGYSPGFFHYYIWNRGQALAPNSWTEVYIDGVKVAEKRTDPVNAGERRREIIYYDYSNCPSCSEHQIEFRLDARNEIEEESEENNRASKNITCSYLLLPEFDLAVENISRPILFGPHRGKITFTLSNR